MNIDKGKKSISSFFDSSHRLRWAILAVVTLVFTFLLYPNLVIEKHQYHLGDVAQRDIKAPKDFFIEDQAATEIKRQKAAAEVVTVYDYDADLVTTLTHRVQQAFSAARAGLEKKQMIPDQGPALSAGQTTSAAASQNAIAEKSGPTSRERFAKQLGIPVSRGAFKVLEQEGFSKKIADQINAILDKILKNGVVTNKEILLKEMNKGIVLRDVSTKKERGVSNLKKFYGLNQAKIMVRIIGQPLLKDTDYTLRNLIVDFVQKLIQPNITLNKSETQERIKKAKLAIKPVLQKIKAGEMLLREGERVSEVQLLKLKSLQTRKKRRQVLLSSLGAAMLLICLLLTSYIIHRRQQPPKAVPLNKDLLLMASVFLTFFLLADLSAALAELLTRGSPYPLAVTSIYFGFPLASGAMIICLLLGLRVALAAATVMAVCIAVIFQNSLVFFIFFLINGTMGAYWIRDCKERKVFITTGAKLGLLNVVLATTIDFYTGRFTSAGLLWDWAFAFLGGIAAGIITAGIAPLAELLFGYTTDITLLELANADRPILRRLMIEAPGTYHHSMIVGSLVEAAASEIGANPLMARVCGYYHDIGKIKKPLYFIENQKNGKNKHDKLAPSMSSLILIAHIKDGVEIARENKLGQVIIDTIRQHHGTSLIRYFFEKAKQLRGEEAVNIDDFRYPGPKPQTREAGLVMLADVIEAASRTLDNPTPSRIQGLVQNLINRVFSDGQLDACELTLRDLHNIAKSFNKILTGIHHHRIEYTEKRAVANGNGKAKSRNAGSDRQPAKPAQDLPEEDQASGAGHLKRLGLS